MASGEGNPLTPLIAQVLAGVSDDLTSGLPAAKAEWAVRTYQNVILPHRLRYAVQETEDELRVQAAAMIGDTCADYRALKPDEKWTEVLRNYYLVKLLPLTDAAFYLAREHYFKERPVAALRGEAEAQGAELSRLVSEIAERAVSVQHRLQALLDDALADFAYVRGETQALSARMAVLTGDSGAGAKTCRACAARPPAGSKYCNLCGTALGCPSCGSEVAEGSQFCNKCGKSLVPAKT